MFQFYLFHRGHVYISLCHILLFLIDVYLVSPASHTSTTVICLLPQVRREYRKFFRANAGKKIYEFTLQRIVSGCFVYSCKQQRVNDCVSAPKNRTFWKYVDFLIIDYIVTVGDPFCHLPLNSGGIVSWDAGCGWFMIMKMFSLPDKTHFRSCPIIPPQGAARRAGPLVCWGRAAEAGGGEACKDGDWRPLSL